jgi:hypothetical protein
MTSDTKASAQEASNTSSEVPRRTRPWRLFAKACVLALMLGAGWIAGAKTPVADLAQVSSTAWAQVVGFGASLETALARMASWAAPRERIASSGVESTPATASPDGNFERIAGKLDQIRAASEGASEESRRSAERLASAMESTSQQLATRLADLGERLDRVERNAPAAAGSVLAKLEQLSERLDRMERGAAVALRPAQPAALATSATPAARSATGPVEAPRPAASPALNLQGLSEARKIPNWVVREVINGKAILQGPRGVIGVSRGDLVPGVGRVQSIARQGGRWIVATNNGVIGAR